MVNYHFIPRIYSTNIFTIIHIPFIGLYIKSVMLRVSPQGLQFSDISIMFDSVTNGFIQNLHEPLNTDVQQMCWKTLMLLRGKRPKDSIL